VTAKFTTRPFISNFRGNLNAWATDLVQDLFNLFLQVSARLNLALQEDGSEAMTGPLQLATFAYAALPTPGTPGRMIYVSNSSTNTWGATIDGAGSGADKVLAWDNGTHWTVVGK
jgi:hypothetical protein